MLHPLGSCSGKEAIPPRCRFDFYTKKKAHQPIQVLAGCLTGLQRELFAQLCQASPRACGLSLGSLWIVCRREPGGGWGSSVCDPGDSRRWAVCRGTWQHSCGEGNSSLLARALCHYLQSPGNGVGLELCVPRSRHVRTALSSSCLSTRPGTCMGSVWWISTELLQGQGRMQSQKGK